MRFFAYNSLKYVKIEFILMHYYVKFHALTDAISFIPDFFLKNGEILKKPVFLKVRGVKNRYISKTTRNFEKPIAPIVLESQNL